MFTNKGSKYTVRALFFLITTFYSLLNAPITTAQQFNVGVEPSQVSILMKPNISLIKAFNYKNQGDPGIYSARVVSFEPIGDQGGRVISDKSEGPVRFSLENSNINLGDKFFLRGKEDLQLLLKIRTTANAPLGDYYYTLFLIAEPSTFQETVSKGRAMLGANILISITESGLTEVNAKVSMFQIMSDYKFNFFGKTFYINEPYSQVPVILKLANVGNYKIVPKVKIIFKGPYMKEQSREMVPVNVLRNSERILQPINTDSCNKCKTTTSAVFNAGFMGKYRIAAELEFEGANKKAFANLQFWVLPIKLTKVVVGSFIMFALLLITVKKRRKK
jgi:hypothetical protein